MTRGFVGMSTATTGIALNGVQPSLRGDGGKGNTAIGASIKMKVAATGVAVPGGDIDRSPPSLGPGVDQLSMNDYLPGQNPPRPPLPARRKCLRTHAAAFAP